MTKKIIGIGNAIVDVICRVEDSFLAAQGLVKGSMSLIDEKKAAELSKLPILQITSGGSVANTIATLAQLSGTSYFVGKVAADEFGDKFIEELAKIGAEFIGQKSSNQTTAKSFILITPDGERTMCTYLGCASQIDEPQDLKNADFLYLEGYLWDDAKTIQTLKNSISLAKKQGLKIAFSLSDSFCVSRHRQDFIDLVLNDLDLLFANENEALELISASEYSSEKLAEFFSKNPRLIAAVTRSKQGCSLFNHNKVIEVPTTKIDDVIDVTGAGDTFAAGFFHGILNDFDLEKSAQYANLLAGKIIQQIGARFDKEQLEKIKIQ